MKSPTCVIECVSCGRGTNHRVVKEYSKRIDVEETGIIYWERAQIVECRGCGTLAFTETASSSEDTDENMAPIPTTAVYPSRTTRKRVLRAYAFPVKIRNLYDEIIRATGSECPTLVAIGVRSLVEAICDDKKCKVPRQLDRSIQKLVDSGYLAAAHVDFMQLQRFVGNDAAHDAEAPDESELDAALDIVESLLTTLYVLPVSVKRMKKSGKKLEEWKSKQKLPPAATPAKAKTTN